MTYRQILDPGIMSNNFYKFYLYFQLLHKAGADLDSGNSSAINAVYWVANKTAIVRCTTHG